MTQTINSSLFTDNRKHLAERLPPNSIAVLNANDVMPTNADGTMRFKQNSDLFYLTGVNQEETILLIFPNGSTGEWPMSTITKAACTNVTRTGNKRCVRMNGAPNCSMRRRVDCQSRSAAPRNGMRRPSCVCRRNWRCWLDRHRQDRCRNWLLVFAIRQPVSRHTRDRQIRCPLLRGFVHW